MWWCGARDSAVLGRVCASEGIVVWQSLRLDGEKFDKSKRWMYRKQKCNKATVCGLPSIHLPLTREASVVVRGEGLLSFCNGCEGGSIRCNGRSKQGKGVSDFRGIVRFLEGLVKRYHL